MAMGHHPPFNVRPVPHCIHLHPVRVGEQAVSKRQGIHSNSFLLGCCYPRSAVWSGTVSRSRSYGCDRLCAICHFTPHLRGPCVPRALAAELARCRGRCNARQCWLSPLPASWRQPGRDELHLLFRCQSRTCCGRGMDRAVTPRALSVLDWPLFVTGRGEAGPRTVRILLGRRGSRRRRKGRAQDSRQESSRHYGKVRPIAATSTANSTRPARSGARQAISGPGQLCSRPTLQRAAATCIAVPRAGGATCAQPGPALRAGRGGGRTVAW
mmetsp:Transcript_30826/g.82550  ORF Transcript_30826/g.82550 Transcript_30826/m.82550 type:complete len:269 (+) Transcript_30826:870-1676(+)